MRSRIFWLMSLANAIRPGRGLNLAQYQHSGYVGGEMIMNQPTVELPLQSTYGAGQYQLAVFLSNDGMHQFDYDNYVAEYPDSSLASLAAQGVVYTSARSSNPSDSFPATAALVAGCSPRTHGLYWDDSYARDLYPPGSACTGPIGTEVDYTEGLDLNNTLLDGGGGMNISTLPLRLTPWGSCAPIFPHEHIRVNTIFEVARGNGLATAYADKHLSYTFVNGPSGTGLVEGYFPEVSSVASTDEAQNGWDDLHWEALNNWVTGKFVNGTSTSFGRFSLIGSNFQGSRAQHALTNAQSTSGYGWSNATAESTYAVPTSNITAVLRHFDDKLGDFIGTLKSQGIWNQTLLIIGSKQGQTPVNSKVLNFVDPQALINATGVAVNFVTAADWALLWLNDSSQAYEAKENLLASNRTVTAVESVLAADEVWQYGWGNPAIDARAPDLAVKSIYGTLYESPGTLEDHGGWYADDANVNLLVVSGQAVAGAGTRYDGIVLNQQIAVTLLQALGLPLSLLDGYRAEGTPVLPCVFS